RRGPAIVAHRHPIPIAHTQESKKIEVTVHASLQLQHLRRTVSRCDPQEEAGRVCLSAFWHRGRSSSLRDRGAAGGFAEWCLSAGRGSPLRPERHPLAL